MFLPLRLSFLLLFLLLRLFLLRLFLLWSILLLRLCLLRLCLDYGRLWFRLWKMRLDDRMVDNVSASVLR